MELSLCDSDVKRLVDAAISKAVVEALGENKDALIGKLVGQALSMKARDYDRQTIFESEVHKMIREAGQAAFKEWLDENLESVKSAVRKNIASRTKSNKDFAANIAEQLVAGMAKNFHVTCTLKVGD